MQWKSRAVVLAAARRTRSRMLLVVAGEESRGRETDGAGLCINRHLTAPVLPLDFTPIGIAGFQSNASRLSAMLPTHRRTLSLSIAIIEMNKQWAMCVGGQDVVISGSIIPVAVPGPWQLRISPKREMSIDLPTNFSFLLLHHPSTSPSIVHSQNVQSYCTRRQTLPSPRPHATPLDCYEAGKLELELASCMNGDSTEEACPEGPPSSNTTTPSSTHILHVLSHVSGKIGTPGPTISLTPSLADLQR